MTSTNPPLWLELAVTLLCFAMPLGLLGLAYVVTKAMSKPKAIRHGITTAEGRSLRRAIVDDRRCTYCKADLPGLVPWEAGFETCGNCDAHFDLINWRSDGRKCRNCGYSIRELGDDPTKPVTCPECGTVREAMGRAS